MTPRFGNCKKSEFRNFEFKNKTETAKNSILILFCRSCQSRNPGFSYQCFLDSRWSLPRTCRLDPTMGYGAGETDSADSASSISVLFVQWDSDSLDMLRSTSFYINLYHDALELNIFCGHIEFPGNLT